MTRVWFPTVNLLSCWVRSVEGQAADSLTTLNSNVSFLESGLTTLGVLSAAITVLARADLAYEIMLRDWQYTVIDTGLDRGYWSLIEKLGNNFQLRMCQWVCNPSPTSWNTGSLTLVPYSSQYSTKMSW